MLVQNVVRRELNLFRDGMDCSLVTSAAAKQSYNFQPPSLFPQEQDHHFTTYNMHKTLIISFAHLTTANKTDADVINELTLII